MVARRSVETSGAPSGPSFSAGWWMRSTSTIATFILIDIQKSFTVDRALAGLLATVTLIMRLVGGAAAGTIADKWGRRLPLMLSVLWFSIFAFLSGFSTSYMMLFALRALFGIGMGGEWAAGMPLVLEHWPTRLRGLASGLLLGGWYWGYLLVGRDVSVRLSALQRNARPWPGERCFGLPSCPPCSRCGFGETFRKVRCGSSDNASCATRRAPAA